MLFAGLINDFAAFIGIFTAIVLSAILWYYIIVSKPYAKFPAWRLEFRIPYWILKGRKLDIVILEKLIEQSRKYETEGLFVLWFFKPRVVVYGEEIVKSILPHTADKPPVFKVAEFSFGSNSLFISNGERWKRRRKMILPALHTKSLKSFVSFMNNAAKTLVEKFSEKKGETIFDMCHVLSQCTLRLFYETNFGVRDGDSKKVEKSVKMIHKTTEFLVYRFFRPWLHFNLLLPVVSYAREIFKVDAENRKTIEQILEQIEVSMAARDQSQVIEEESDQLSNRPKSIGEIIINNHLKFPTFTMEELAKEVYFLIFAGFDTTAHALMWTFYALGRNPDIQDRVYDEIVTLEKEDIQYADVLNLTYLDCVIKESLRKYTIPLLARIVTKDVQCGNYFIPKNTEVLLFPFMLHRDKNIYPDPEKFDPDRFMDKNSKIKPWNHIPFMEGPRPCIGKNYAMLSMKIFLVHILRNFKVISLDREEDLKFKVSLVLCAENKPRMKFIPRHEQTRLRGSGE